MLVPTLYKLWDALAGQSFIRDVPVTLLVVGLLTEEKGVRSGAVSEYSVRVLIIFLAGFESRYRFSQSDIET